MATAVPPLWTYLAVARGAFRRYSTYRAATFAGAVTNSVFGCILAYTFRALWHARPGLGGYDTRQAVTYIWVSQALSLSRSGAAASRTTSRTASAPATSPSTSIGRWTSRAGGWRATSAGPPSS